MVNAFLVTNLIEGLHQEEKEKYLQIIQKAVGKHNFRIMGTIIDHSEGEFPFFGEILELLGDVISTGQCDAIILDDTYNYDATKAYERLSELADSYNTAIFHYEDGVVYMGNPNDDFDYDEEPFEVFELEIDDEPEENWFGSFSKGIGVICEDFKNHVADMPPCERHREMHSFVDGMIGIVEVLIEEASKMQEQLMDEVKRMNKKTKKRKGE